MTLFLQTKQFKSISHIKWQNLKMVYPQCHCTLSWFGTGTSIKSGWV